MKVGFDNGVKSLHVLSWYSLDYWALKSSATKVQGGSFVITGEKNRSGQSFPCISGLRGYKTHAQKNFIWMPPQDIERTPQNLMFFNFSPIKDVKIYFDVNHLYKQLLFIRSNVIPATTASWPCMFIHIVKLASDTVYKTQRRENFVVKCY